MKRILDAASNNAVTFFKAMSAAMSPTYHQRPMPGTQEPGNHSFTSKDSGTGDSVPTEHNQFLSKLKR